MATIEWGNWEDSGGNGMRVGLEISKTGVSNASTEVRYTVNVYTQNRSGWGVSDDQWIAWSDALSGTTGYGNNNGTSAVLRDTKVYTHTYGGSSYGSSPGNRTFTAGVTGANNGVSPSQSVTVTLPARPYAAPASVSSLSAARVSDSAATVTWTNNATNGQPYDGQWISRWDNATNSWSSPVTLSGAATSYSATGLSANRAYRWRVQPTNSVGWALYNDTPTIQNTPAAPHTPGISATATTIQVSWVNAASGTNYDYTTQVEQSVNGGAYALVSTLAEGVTATQFSGLTAGNTYQYRMRAVSTVGGATNSSYTTTASRTLLAPPAAPTAFTATRSTDTSMNLSWTNNPTVNEPYDSVTVQRWDSTSSAWMTVANLATGNTFNDTTTVADRKYQYRIKAVNTAGESSPVDSAFIYTTPGAPINANGGYTAATTITATWTNTVSYAEHGLKVQPWKDGVAQATVTLAGNVASYALTGVDVTKTYYFKVWAVSNTGALPSSVATSNSVAPPSAPSAPGDVAMTDGPYVDFIATTELTWTHNESTDGSAMRKYQIQHRAQGAGSWTTDSEVTSSTESANDPWTIGTYANGTVVEFQVRTWGIHANPSPWSSTGTVTGHATPTLALVTPTATYGTSSLTVDWDFYQAQGATQAEYLLTVNDVTNAALVGTFNGEDTASEFTVPVTVADDTAYELWLSVRDSVGEWTAVTYQAFTVDFMPPAESVLAADLDADSGAVVLTLTPGTDDGGITTQPATVVDIERQVYDPETGEYGDWEMVAQGVAPNATIIDTTAPIHGDGHYRATTYSALPSSYAPLLVVPLSSSEEKWAYLSSGNDFREVCRLWANIELTWKASRNKSLHYFAGRGRPVMYTGEAKDKVLEVTALLADDASPVQQWLRLAQLGGPVLFRAPGYRRVFGAMSEVEIQRIQPGLSRISFSIQEVYR